MSPTQILSRATIAALIAALGACGLVPKEPIVQQPMTARPPQPPVGTRSPGAIYNAGYAGRPLFEDQRPRNVGDILTIVISENVNATKSSAANTNRAGNGSFAVPTTPALFGGLFNNTNLSATGANKFAATGGASAANTFSGTLTVTVTEVLPHGNLMVRGEKQ